MSRTREQKRRRAPRPTDEERRRRVRRNAPQPEVYAHGISRHLLDRDAVKVIRRLNSHGHLSYLVGGGVRDLVLERTPKDFDVATSAMPQEVRSLFRNCRVIGRRFRLAHVLFGGGKIIEVATFRKDLDHQYEERGGEDGEPVRLVPTRREGVEDADLLIRNDNVFGEPHEDAIRRDFTINGLFYDLERQEVIDYVGGMVDLERRVLKTIGDPDVRFREDPVRILRAIKFAARLDFGFDPDLYDAIVETREQLVRSARPRILEEILRFLRSGAAERSFFLTQDTGVLAMILPELASLLDDRPDLAELTYRRLLEIDRLHTEEDVLPDAVLLTTLLLGVMQEFFEDETPGGPAIEEMLGELSVRLALPRRLKDRVRVLFGCQHRLALGRLGSLPRREFFEDAVMVCRLDFLARKRELPEWLCQPRSEIKATPRPRRRRRRRRRH